MAQCAADHVRPRHCNVFAGVGLCLSYKGFALGKQFVGAGDCFSCVFRAWQLGHSARGCSVGLFRHLRARRGGRPGMLPRAACYSLRSASFGGRQQFFLRAQSPFFLLALLSPSTTRRSQLYIQFVCTTTVDSMVLGWMLAGQAMVIFGLGMCRMNKRRVHFVSFGSVPASMLIFV